MSGVHSDRCLETDEIGKMLSDWNVADCAPDSFISIIAPRRSGKSTLCEFFVHEYRKAHKVDAIFLFSKTQSGFPQIPSKYRFRTLDKLDDIINIQVKVKNHNMKQKIKRNKVKSRVIIILDDFVGGQKELRRNKMMDSLATNGRHLSGDEDVSMMTICLSQIFTGLSPTIRLNTDYTLFTSMANRLERKALVDAYCCLHSGRHGLKEGYNLFDVCLGDYVFLCCNGTQANKRDYPDYMYLYKAKPSKKISKEKWIKDDEAWKNNTQHFEWCI
tara:strand:- start:2 stop:820 length:819 start_codon:yes stop_codon:yes gene_type:complete